MDPGKPIRYGRHARVRMLERQIVGGMVEDTLWNRDSERPGNIPGSIVAVKDLGKMELCVVYLEFPDYYLICSVFEG